MTYGPRTVLPMTALTTTSTSGAVVRVSAHGPARRSAASSWWDLADRRRETGQPRDPRQNRTSAAPQTPSA